MHKDLYANIHSSAIHKSKIDNNPNVHQLMNVYIKHGISITTECHRARKRNEVQVHATTWKDFKNSVLGERSPMADANITHYMSLVI